MSKEEVEEVIVKTQCWSCHGTGVFHGRSEPEGVGVVYQRCGGTGCVEIEYVPFRRRKKRDDIQVVRLPGEGLIGEQVRYTTSVSYETFLVAKMPKPSK